jgi:antitoxin component of RelBE/YafQ-DinJ toxin-antitoxin module
MPIPFSGKGRRKQFQLPQSQIDKLAERAEFMDTSVSDYVRMWVTEYAETNVLPKGFVPDSPDVNVIQVIIDPDVVQRAETQAAAAGTTLRDIIRYRIAKLK